MNQIIDSIRKRIEVGNNIGNQKRIISVGKDKRLLRDKKKRQFAPFENCEKSINYESYSVLWNGFLIFKIFGLLIMYFLFFVILWCKF